MKDLRLYDSISSTYVSTRRADSRVAAWIHNALEDAERVVNVGAGTGNYEPDDRRVVAVEPSAGMIAKRPSTAAPAIRAAAEELPLKSAAFDAALAILTVHHWRDRRRGLAEMRRVARKQVIFLFDPVETNRFWAIDYWPDALSLPSEPTLSDPTTLPRCSTLPTCTPSRSPSIAPTGSARRSGAARRPTSTPRYSKAFHRWPSCSPRSWRRAQRAWPRTCTPANGTAITDISAI